VQLRVEWHEMQAFYEKLQPLFNLEEKEAWKFLRKWVVLEFVR